jgi:hypothetical protein
MEYSYVTGKSGSDSELRTSEPTPWRLLGKVNTQSLHSGAAMQPRREPRREFHKAPRARRIGKAHELWVVALQPSSRVSATAPLADGEATADDSARS